MRYVAEENSEVLNEPGPDHPGRLMTLAGRYFKRWDATTQRFVSNMRDEYPDD